MLAHYTPVNKYCIQCGTTLKIGEECILHEDGYFCETHCLKEHLLEGSGYKNVTLSSYKIYRDVNWLSEKLSFYEKLIKIQQELKAPKGNFNKFGNFRYRSAEDILEAVKPINAKYELFLTLTDEPLQIGERYYIQATASITDGEKEHNVTAYAREALNKKGMDDSQITGTASSYARKYALNGLYLIDDTKDADTDEYQQQTIGNQNELNTKIINLFATALNKVGGRDKLYKQLDLNKTKMTELTKSDNTKEKERIIKKLEEINNGN